MPARMLEDRTDMEARVKIDLLLGNLEKRGRLLLDGDGVVLFVRFDGDGQGGGGRVAVEGRDAFGFGFGEGFAHSGVVVVGLMIEDDDLVLARFGPFAAVVRLQGVFARFVGHAGRAHDRFILTFNRQELHCHVPQRLIEQRDLPFDRLGLRIATTRQ